MADNEEKKDGPYKTFKSLREKLDTLVKMENELRAKLGSLERLKPSVIGQLAGLEEALAMADTTFRDAVPKFTIDAPKIDKTEEQTNDGDGKGDPPDQQEHDGTD